MPMKEWIATFDEDGELEVVKEMNSYVPKKRALVVRAKTMAAAALAAQRLFSTAKN